MRFPFSFISGALLLAGLSSAHAQVTINFGSYSSSTTLENTGGGGEFGYLFINPEDGLDSSGQSSGGAFGFKQGITAFGAAEDIPFDYRITQIDVSITTGSNATSDDITVYLETAGNSVEFTASPFGLSAGNTTFMSSFTPNLVSSSSDDQLYFALINRSADSVAINDVSLVVYASPVPEPATAASLLGVAALLLAGQRRRRR